MKVIGIDPAPTKGLAVFDGRQYQHVGLEHARGFLQKLPSDTLVCWDAPLSGPPSSVVNGGPVSRSAFSQRFIESFFSREETGFKTPKGISVRGYSGCPHWALSRSLLGLPRTGPFDTNASLPFRHIASDEQRPNDGRCIVEVHPAVALWLWCKREEKEEEDWEYKQKSELRERLWKRLQKQTHTSGLPRRVFDSIPDDDDEADARIAYALGWLWLNRPGSVVLVGNLDRGSFLLPNVRKIAKLFSRSA